MNKSAQTYCLMDSAKGITNRVVFQLDLLEDTLRYCLWTGSSDENRAEGTINDFRKALHNCNIVHPDDLNTCDRIFQKQTDGLAITTSEIRVHKGLSGYIWFRLYTISSNDVKGKMVAINGVLECIQTDKAITRRSREQIQQDSLFRQAVTCDSLLSMGFDYITGKRLISDLDVLPKWLPKEMDLKSVAYTLFSQAVYPQEQYKLESLVEQTLHRGTLITTKPFYCDCRLRDLSRQTPDFRWYRVYHSFTGSDSKQHACFYLTIMDIQEAKTKEQHSIEQSRYDQLTGMLNRDAFESQVTNWLQRMKRETFYTFLCAVIILVDNPIEINNLHGRAYLAERIGQLGNTVKAFIHPHEMCCRYGLGEFAMILAGDNRDILDERLKMLQFVCNAQKTDYPDVHIFFGCNIETASKSDSNDFFLEKAYQALLSVRNKDANEKIIFSPVYHASSNQKKKKAESLDMICNAATTQGKPSVFIRTFGHFDVFVDGEAVLFNHPKAKELFALLVDRRGGFVSASEAISCLWEDEPSNQTTLARCRKAALHLRKILTSYGIDMIIQTVNGKRRVLVDRFDCDYYQYLHHGADASQNVIGTYMNEYSWAESSIATE